MEETDKPRSRRTSAWIAFVLLGVLMLYPLSVGPVILLDKHGWLNDSADHIVYVFYRPLNYICDWTGTRELLEKYAELWIR